MIAGRSPADLLDQPWDDAPAEPGLSEELIIKHRLRRRGLDRPGPVAAARTRDLIQELGAAPRIVDVLGWAPARDSQALRAATDLMDKFAWGSHVENYLEFS